MKKLHLLFVYFTFCLFSIFASPLDEDCLYLEQLFSEVSIDISLALDEKNLTSKDIVAEIKTIYQATASAKKEKQNGIDEKAFAEAINIIYSKYSYKNGHVNIFTENELFLPFEHSFIYYSDVYFTKENESYVVYKTYKNIKKGMHYSGSHENLFKTIYNNQTLYRYGTISSQLIKNSMIQVENKEYKVPVAGNAGITKTKKNYDFKKIDDCLYLKIDNCHYTDKALEEQFFIDSEEIIQNFQNSNSIIFDLRNNFGGFSKYLKQFTYALLYSSKSKENDQEFEEWNLALHSNHKRINTLTMINKTRSVGLAPEAYLNDCMSNLDQKYLTESFAEKPISSPWYKGKIYIITNPLTCSAAEEFILFLKNLYGSNAIIIGQNTYGSLDFPDVYSYVLPNSKIRLRLCAVDYRQSNILKEASWHGDTMGVFPDYWCKPKDIASVLAELSGKNELKDSLELLLK